MAVPVNLILDRPLRCDGSLSAKGKEKGKATRQCFEIPIETARSAPNSATGWYVRREVRLRPYGASAGHLAIARAGIGVHREARRAPATINAEGDLALCEQSKSLHD